MDALLKKSEAQHEQPEDGCPFGALTQRLLQALVEVSTPAPSSHHCSLCSSGAVPKGGSCALSLREGYLQAAAGGRVMGDCWLLKRLRAWRHKQVNNCTFPSTAAAYQENIISPMEDSPIPDMSGKESGADGASTSPRNQNKPFR